MMPKAPKNLVYPNPRRRCYLWPLQAVSITELPTNPAALTPSYSPLNLLLSFFLITTESSSFPLGTFGDITGA